MLGALPPFEVETPWWQEVESVVRAVHQQHGVGLTILRLLSAPDGWPGGTVTYLAEVGGPVEVTRRLPMERWQGTLSDHPLRMPWANAGGPAADMAWARGVLAERGLNLSAEPVQVRTWNLSSLWRLPLATETAWFKSVPPFFEHEGRLLERLQGGRVPRLLAHSGRRLLLHEIPGDDLYEPTLEQLHQMVTHIVELQAGWIGRTEELLALGLPDWRAPALVGAVEDVVGRAGGPLSTEERAFSTAS
ncbi:hypothetical protein BH24CHL6_BH24CHL6_10580 [soil metagenome]